MGTKKEKKKEEKRRKTDINIYTRKVI